MPLPSILSMCLPFTHSELRSSCAATASLHDAVEVPQPPPDAPAQDMALWSKSRVWRRVIQNAQTPIGPGKTEGVDSYFAQKMLRALTCLGTDLLLPQEVATRDLALDLLRTAPPSRFWPLRWRFTREQGQQLWDAIRLGETCVFTGPVASRRPRSRAELAALRTLVQWARDGDNPRQRAAFVASLRRAEWINNSTAIVHWHEPEAHGGELGPLELPPRDMIEALIARGRTRLAFRTHSFRIDDPSRFADSLAAFGHVILQLLQIPSEAAALRMPRGFSLVDVSRLPDSLDWSDLAPLGRFLPDWPDTVLISRSGQLLPNTIEDFERLFLEQILFVGGDEREGRQQTLQRILAAAREQPELSEGIRTALRRNRGGCLDANLMRLEEIEALVDAGKALRHPADRALFFFRQALKLRAQQTAAGHEQKNDENLEIGHGLAWAVDRRLVDLLGVSPSAAEPVYQRLARLPGAVDPGTPVNDAHAADAVIAAEIRGGFPTLAFIAAGGHTLSARMGDALEEDEVFLEKKKAIDEAFEGAYAEAFDLAPDDPDAGTEAFLKKEEDVIRARVDCLAHHLQPTLATLRAAGIGIDPAAERDGVARA